MTPSLRALLGGVIDYAGLFPPAAIEMAEAVQRFGAYRSGPHGWMLGRMIVPMALIDEFERALADSAPEPGRPEPWPVSVVAAYPYDGSVARIWDFNGRHGACGDRVAIIDSIEAKAETVSEVERLADAVPAGFDLFVEAPAMNAPPGLLESIARSGGAAKLRTGGVLPEHVPPALGLATSVVACHRAGISFKATAGLHHPIRADRPLTYDARPPRAKLHGFLNLLVASAVVRAGWVDATGAAEVLAEESPDAFTFASDSLAWRGHQLTMGELRASRRFLRSFGSCSFDEPVAGLETLALL